MIGKSLHEYVFIRFCITGLRLVCPLCAAYISLALYRGQSLLTPIGLYALAEVTFYFAVFLPRSKRLQAESESAPRLTAEERRALFDQCLQCMDGESLSGWFLTKTPSGDIRVKRDNVADWLYWALFSSQTTNPTEEWQKEMEHYLSYFSSFFGYELDVGRNVDINTLRLSMDPVVAIHRPLGWYGAVLVVDSLTSVGLWRLSFQHYNVNKWFYAFPPRPLLSVLSDHGTDPGVPYWYRPHRSKDKLPVMFLHGIGIGLYPYVAFLREIIELDPDVGILAPEILPISMHMTAAPLPREQMCRVLERILDAHNLPRVVVVSHSYGTAVTAHLHHDARLAPRVAATLFVDPIPFLLHHPAVAYNFLYRVPRSANEWQLWFFASRDADIARALGRHFHWFENVLFRDELAGRRVAVALAGQDQIVNAPKVREYLTGQSEPAPRWEGDGLEVLYHPDLDHATVFDTIERRKPLLDVVSRFIKLN